MDEVNNNPTEDESQWGVFCSQHCKIWFGVVKDFDSTGSKTDEYGVMHSYKPRRHNSFSEIEHHNVYYYEDTRGTVNSSPRCGPWFYREQDSWGDVKGVQHPKWPHTKYVLFPTGSGIMFNNSPLNYGSVETCIKMFLHHPTCSNIRLSVMVQYLDYHLDQFKVYFQNSEGWKSEFWENQEKQDLVTESCHNKLIQSRKRIDTNLNVVDLDQKPRLLTVNNNPQSFTYCEETPNIFEYLIPGYVQFQPAANVLLVFPKKKKPPGELLSPEVEQMSPLSSPRENIPVSSYVGVRWIMPGENLATDFVAEFDRENRFSHLTQIDYTISP